ncbi:MAG: prepilin-type N-terminal cleavage/methylation domain-containing protein [Blastomonas sp.]
MNRNGFTLVEILVALLLASLLLVPLSWTLAQLSNDLKTERDHAESLQWLDDEQLLRTLLTDGLFRDADGQAYPSRPDRLIFRARSPMALGRPGFVSMELRSADDAQGGMLIAFPGLERDLSATRIFGGSHSANIKTVRDAQDDGIVNRVDLELTDASGAHRTMTIVPRTTSRGSCVFDLVAMSCR